VGEHQELKLTQRSGDHIIANAPKMLPKAAIQFLKEGYRRQHIYYNLNKVVNTNEAKSSC
jgi:hypothetical protein